ncbi:MAG TPA: DUF2059 domain-containing protein [Gemmatimonadales bacterium]|nr:DUF2059 domain-containing protein [Gemmatimonadales bacterium]
MTRAPLLSLALLLQVAFVPAAVAQNAPVDSSTMRASRELMAAMRAGEAALTGMNLAMERERTRVPAQLPPLFFDRAKAAFEHDLPELVEQMALIYARHFSRDELVQLTAFYRTPVGVRVANESGLVGAEASEMAQRWGAALGLKVMQEMIAKGEMQVPQ